MAVQGAVLEGKVAGSAAGTMGDFGVVVALGVDMTAQTPAADEVIGKRLDMSAVVSGIAISFCDGAERGHLRSIERLTKQYREGWEPKV